MKKYTLSQRLRTSMFSAALFLIGLAGSVFAGETVLSFSGTDSYVDLGMPDALQLASNSPMTVEGWVYLNTVGSRNMIYSKNNDRSDNGHTHMFGFYNNGRITAYTGKAWREPSPTVTVDAQRWLHVAFSFDGTNMTYYIDGESVGTSAFNFNNVAANTVKLGGYKKDTDINGMKSDVRVWDHARSVEQIQAYMNRRLSGYENGLLGYWPLNEGVDAQAFDRTAYASTGAVINATWVTDNDFILNSPILAHPVTGSRLFTNTNAVDVLDVEIPSQYSHYQVTFTNDASQLTLGGWVETNTPLQRVVFPQPDGDTNLIACVWFTNLTESVALDYIEGNIFYTTAQPTVTLVPTLTRHLVEGVSTVVLTTEDLDAGSTGGTANSQTLSVFDLQISSTSDTTPAAPEVTLVATGVFEVVLTVINEAGNYAVATSTVTLVEGGLRTWTGLGTNALASTAANWSSTNAPVTGNSVQFDTSSSNCIWDLDIILSEWTQTTNYSGTVTFSTVYPGQGSFTNLVIGRNATLLGGIWTHPANSGGATEVERLSISVGGTFTLSSAAAINLDGKGFVPATGPGAGTGGTTTAAYSASHGGAGARNPATSGTYGSITRPENLGSGAQGSGGGALRLTVGGTAAISGTISAQGVNTRTSTIGNYCHGSGGSILIEAGAFVGNGIIRAGIDIGKACYYGSGGGRIALLSDSATDFSGLALTANPHTQTRNGGGRAGTIYLETPTERRLIINQGNIGAASANHTDLPARLASDDPHPAFDSELADVALIVTNGGFVGLTRDLRVGTIAWLKGTLKLNAWTLYVRSEAPEAAFPGAYGGGTIAPAGVYYTFANGDTLTRDGRLFWGDSNVTWRAVSVSQSAVGGSTAIDGGASEGYYAPGSELSFLATTNSGYAFIHWDGTLDSGTSSPDNPLVPAPINGNLALRAWFRDASQDLATNSWVPSPSNDNWFDPLNWSLFAAPTAGQTVIIPAGAAIRLTAATPLLGRCEILSGATLTFEGWETALKADEIVIAGTVTHEAQTVTEPDSESGEWVPQHRVWLQGSNLTVTDTGSIDADARGYSHGAGPGNAGDWLTANGGGGYGGHGGDGFGGHKHGPAYGDPADPWQPGSGGGMNLDLDGVAGGAIRIEMSRQVIVNGSVTACGQNGGATHANGASGGGIAIYCDTFQGATSGSIRVDGGRGNYYGGNGGGGRIAIHFNPTEQEALPNPRPDVRFSAHAWETGSRKDRFTVTAQMGTLYMTDTTLLADSPTAPVELTDQRFWYTRLYFGRDVTSWTPESLVISNCVIGLSEGFTLAVNEDLTLIGTEAPFVGEEPVRAGLSLYAVATNELYGARLMVGRDLMIGTNTWIYPHTEGTSSAIVGMRVGRNVTVDAGGGIDADDKGYLPQIDNANGPGAGVGNNSGGSYGGLGGGSMTGQTYGLAILPLEPGSPGGWRDAWSAGGVFTPAGKGGGAIHLIAGGTLTLNGLLTANGGHGFYYAGPGGSGGSIFLSGRRILGTGRLQANGGASERANAPGGGGRISIWHSLPLNVVEERIATMNTASLLHSPVNATFTGELQAAVTPTTSKYQPEEGTVGFYSIPGTVIIVR